MSSIRINVRRLTRLFNDDLMDEREYLTKVIELVPEQTAVIVSDMWAEHWCAGATRRVAELAPQMNKLLKHLREQGLQIIFCPSGTENYYKNSYRKQQDVLKDYNIFHIVSPEETYFFNENIIPDIQSRIDPNRIQCDCSLEKCNSDKKPWKEKGQIAELDIKDNDILAFDNEKAIRYLIKGNFKHVLMMGVHTNMCVIYRLFGLKQLRMAGIVPIIVRDMTDSMTPREEVPYQDHFTALDHTIRFIEEYIGPSTTSTDLVGTPKFEFKEDLRRVWSSNWGNALCKSLFDDYDDYLNKGLLDPVKMTCWVANDGIGISAIEMVYYKHQLPTHGKKEGTVCSISIPFGNYISAINIMHGKYKNYFENIIYCIELRDKNNKRLGVFGSASDTRFTETKTVNLIAPEGYRMNSINGWLTSDSKELGGLGFRCQPIRKFEISENGETRVTDILESYGNENYWETFFINGCWRDNLKGRSEAGLLYETWIHKDKSSSDWQKTKISDMKIVHKEVDGKRQAERVAVKNLINPTTEVDVRVYFDYNDQPIQPKEILENKYNIHTKENNNDGQEEQCSVCNKL